jgi:hypothetical protein
MKGKKIKDLIQSDVSLFLQVLESFNKFQNELLFLFEHCHIYMVKQIIVSWSTSRLLEIDIIFTYHAAISEQSEKTTKLLRRE